MKKSILAVLALLLVAGNCYAEDFSTALAKTMSQIPDGADVAGMGNASTATPEFSSRNPAIIAVESKEKFNASGTATYGLINFSNGPKIDLYSVSGTFKLPVGAMQINLSNAGSNVGAVDEMTDAQFNSAPSINLQYGLKLGKNVLADDDSLYGGVSYSYGTSKITMHVADPILGDIFDITKSTSKEVGLGALYQFGVVNVGAFYAHSWDSADEYINDALDNTTKSQTDTLRLGLGVHVTSSTYVAMDYRHLYLPNGEHDDQYYIGLEQYIIKDVLALYAGYADGGATAGVGIYGKSCGLNLGYMHRPFRATEEVFGKAEVFMLSIYGTF